MAFLKRARAAVVRPAVDLTGWNKIRVASNGGVPFTKEAAKVVLQQYDPAEYLLTHCTIVASVDTEAVKAPLGTQMIDGTQIDRRYADFYVTQQTQKYINNNFDSFERKLLGAAFRTFIGAENYVEHIQIPSMSRGKIIDAALRDVGDSTYVDILLATARKHKDLVNAITTGRMGTLSMGCFLPGTPVTMADGTRVAIEDVQPGDMVLTHKGRAREVTNKQIRIGSWSMRRIEVVGVPDAIEATDNHPFYVLRPSRECGCGCGETLSHADKDPVRRLGKRFKKGHYKRVYNPNGTYSIQEARERRQRMEDIHSHRVEKVRADELEPGDYVVFPKVKTSGAKDPGVSKARLLGYFLAEGSFIKYRGTPTAVEFNFSLSERETFAEEVLLLLKEAFPGCKPWVQERPDRSTCTVHVSGRQIAKWFYRNGGEYSATKQLSNEVMGWGEEAHLHLIGAWLNGDGHKRQGNGTVGTTTSYALACQLHLLAIRCGMPVRLECLYGNRTATIAEAVVGGVSRRHEVSGNLAAFNLVFPSSTSATLQEVSRKAPVRAGRERHLRTMDDHVIFPITKIETFSYEGAVHDMEVEEDHSYLVHNMAVSNCQVQFTICTKCGNVAYDETQLCPHIKYQKGTEFYDELGNKRRVAELCGHVNAEPGSVKFIEASWVANPAFTGAVLRNILTPEEASQVGPQIMAAHEINAGQAQDESHMDRAASTEPLRVASSDWKTADFDFSSPDGGEGSSDAGGAPKKDKDPVDKIVDDLKGAIRERALKDLREEVGKGEAKKVDNTADENQNDTLIKSALKHTSWRGIAKSVLGMSGCDPQIARKVLLGLILHKQGGWNAVAASRQFSGSEILAVSRVIDRAVRRASIAGESRVYRTVMVVGGTSPYRTVADYLSACRKVVGRDLTSWEKAHLIVKGRLYSMGS